jgi:hypothetical protein
MNFYKQYPMMRPYFGNNFHDANTPSVLLIGESHYLPQGSSQHLSAETWYAGSSDTLSPELATESRFQMKERLTIPCSRTR